MPKIGCPCGFTAETVEDFGAIVFMVVLGAVVTSPCWGFALFLAVTK